MAMTYNYFKSLVGARRGYFPALMSSIAFAISSVMARPIW
jgi:hypothetical protein